MLKTQSKIKQILLVSNAKEKEKSHFLHDTLVPLGKIYTVQEKELTKNIKQHKYDLVIIDAAEVQEITPLISTLKRQRSGIRVIVVTASPTWEVAREMFRSGACDYLDRSLNKDEFRSRVKSALALPVVG
jgi:DNA-binding NtrC family response regulator